MENQPKQVKCPYCDQVFGVMMPNQQPPVAPIAEQKSGKTRWIAMVGVAIVSLMIGRAIGSLSTPGGSGSAKATEVTETTKTGDTSTGTSTGSAPTENWTYESEVDKMTSKNSYFAKAVSTNKLDLSPPYSGDNWERLLIRNKDGENSVELTIDKGQFVDRIQGGNITVRFDQNQPETFGVSGAADYDPTILFVSDADKFIRELKKAKKVIIAATVFQDGEPQMEFDVAGFKWDHSSR